MGAAARSPAVAGLVVIGAGWGLTLPLLKVAVSTGYPPLGLLLWHEAIMVALLGAVLLVRRRRPPRLTGRHLQLCAGVALLGALLPGYFSFVSAGLLPAGVRAAIIALVPLFALPIAILVGFERPDARRAAGVLAGAAAIGLIALPGTGLPAAAGLGAILIALVSPLSYGMEANYLAWRGSQGLHPVEVAFGAAVVGTLLALPLAAGAGQLVWLRAGWGTVEAAVVVSGALNAASYAGYVWLVGRAGSVFASQIAYVVTAFGVLWSMTLLGERYALTVWVAFALMMAGVALVQPRPAADGP